MALYIFCNLSYISWGIEFANEYYLVIVPIVTLPISIQAMQIQI